MSAKITRLRIAGFKSFADPATIDILPGLTGIVGPNGCGKSNVVEALRWAMGESSARALRGGELDDLIFAGTSARPARSLAEVTLWLEEATGLAPPPFSEAEGLEICRRAERGSGSDFRLNGRALRARDVTTMFADLSSGARSSSIVSQNRVSALISAKPEERRSLLEEAAGITGLHARRHDAELKLRQAEANMERSEDLRQQIEARLATLDAQSVQARSYRSLSEAIREDEQRLAWLIYSRARDLVDRTQEMLHAAEKERDDAAALSLEATQEGETGKARCHALRETVDTLREARDRLRVLAETTRLSLNQTQAKRDDNQRRCEQDLSDHALARSRRDELAARLDILTTEQHRLDAALATLPDQLTALREARSASAIALANCETQRAQCAETLMTQRLAAQKLEADYETIDTRLAALDDEEQTLAHSITELQSSLPDEAGLASLEQALEAKRRERDACTAEYERLTAAVQDARLGYARASQVAAQAQNAAQDHREATERLATRLASLTAQLDKYAGEYEALLKARPGSAVLEAGEVQVESLRQSCDAARNAATEAQSTLTESDQTLRRHETDLQGIDHQRRLLTNEQKQAQAAVSRYWAQIETLRSARNTIEAGRPDETAGADLSTRRESAQNESADLANRIDIAARNRDTARTAHENAEKSLREARAAHLALQARLDALRTSLPSDGLPDSLLDALSVPDGLERAVASAFDQTLEASLDPAQNRAWLQLPAVGHAPLPGGVTALATLLDAPPALSRCLAHIGIVTDSAQGEALHPQLSAGQSLVSRDGALWRWDGYRAAGDLPSTALGRVEHLAALRTVEAECDEASSRLPALSELLNTARCEEEARANELVSLRTHLQHAEKTLSRARQEEAAFLAQHERYLGQIAQNDHALAEAQVQYEQAEKRVTAADEALSALPDAQALAAKADILRQTLSQARKTNEEALKALRLAESAYRTARDEATRLRLQDEANASRLSTLSGVLAQARQDRDGLENEKQALEKIDPGREAEATHRAKEEAHRALQTVEHLFITTDTTLTALRQAIGADEHALQERRDLRLSVSSRLSALLPRRAALEQTRTSLREQRASLASIPDLTPLEQSLHDAQSAETAQRERNRLCYEAQRQAESDLSRTEQEKEQIVRRLAEATALGATLDDDFIRLETRVRAAQEERASIDAEHDRLQTHANENTHALEAAERDYDEAAQTLSALENAIDVLARTRQQEDERCAQARETVIRLQERLDQARKQFETLDETPPAPPMTASGQPLADTASSDQSESALKRRLARNQKEREALGPVNLLAEQEYSEAEAQASHLAHEHQELDSAIARLRGSINMLKKEGRERLQAIFVEVDRHFQSLFSRMFNGGKAHLGLVGSDDPLEAGLEIFAQPPGKKLSTLSLLSGGEQALTALSLIFATFRCQPSPLCILDEVDAPLDDANVECLCSLLKDMAEEAQTRFLIVTHHQLTMAHMDRLFGVTMQERGVSQVLSVDLALAASFAENGASAAGLAGR